MKNIIIILGTRPEAIKLAPVILELRKNPHYKVYVCNTEQQKGLSNQALGFFGIKADFNLDVMQVNQTLPGVQSRILEALSAVYTKRKFDATIVQGDTMTVFCGALVSFYHRIPVFHVEAGLRSYDLKEPFPEEAIRQMTSRITSLHFAPTQNAYDALLREGIPPERIAITGNTVVDALFCLTADTLSQAEDNLRSKGIYLNDKLVLITAHRRENHGKRMDRLLNILTELTQKYSDHQFIVPVHPNPNVKNKVYSSLNMLSNVILTEPLDYPELVCIMKRAKLILTDSGGIQEEAPTFGVPVLVLRNTTERMESVLAGFSKLVGIDKRKIITASDAVLKQDISKTRLICYVNPYGDGKAAQTIATEISKFWKARK